MLFFPSSIINSDRKLTSVLDILKWQAFCGNYYLVALLKALFVNVYNNSFKLEQLHMFVLRTFFCVLNVGKIPNWKKKDL